MKIIKKGEIIPLLCVSCGCEFHAGIKSVREDDGNYYAYCPMCAAECHTDVAKIHQYWEEHKDRM